MLELINTNDFCKIKFVKNINEYLIFTKNLFNILNRKGFFLIESSMLFPLRWSVEKQTWVIDLGTQKQRDIEGIDLNNLNDFYENDSYNFLAIKKILSNINKDTDNLLTHYKFKISNDRFVALSPNSICDTSNLKFYPLGIYRFCQNKKRKGMFSSKDYKSVMIDMSVETLNLITQNSLFLNCFVKNINLDYDLLKRDILETKINYDKDKQITLQDYVLHKFTQNDSVDIYDSELNKNNIHMHLKNIFLKNFFINIEKYIDTKEKIILSYDNKLTQNIKLTSMKNIQQYPINKPKKKKSNISYLPGVF